MELNEDDLDLCVDDELDGALRAILWSPLMWTPLRPALRWLASKVTGYCC